MSLKRISIFVFSFLFLGVFNTGCQNKWAGEEYMPLVKMDPENLSYVELYNRALTLWDVNFEEIDIPTKQGVAHLLMAGPENAEPIVLLHGMNSSSTMWYPNIETLAKNYRVYAIDFILEPGKSVAEKQTMDIDEIVAWYIEIFEHLKLEKMNLVGASRGGWLATNIALQHPERIEKLALLSPAQTFMWIPIGRDMFTNIKYSISPKREDLRKALQTLSANVDGIEQLYIDQYYRATTMSNANEAIAQMQPFSDDELASLKMPILLLIGDDDSINTSESIEKAKELMANVTTKVIAKSGHFLSVDRPKNVNKELLDFLAN